MVCIQISVPFVVIMWEFERGLTFVPLLIKDDFSIEDNNICIHEVNSFIEVSHDFKFCRTLESVIKLSYCFYTDSV